MKIQENFSKTLNLVLCIYDKKMNPILGNPQPEALNPRRFNIIINKKIFGTCEISPKENCTLSDIEIECIGESVSELISRLIENSIEKEIRYEGWKKNEQYNLESLVKSTENLKKDISEWLETKENDPSQNNKYGTKELLLSNGAKVILKHTGNKTNNVSLKAFSQGGNSLYPEADHYNYSYINSVIPLGGLGDLSNQQLAKTLEGHTVNYRAAVNMTNETLDASCATGDEKTLMQCVYLRMTTATSKKSADTP